MPNLPIRLYPDPVLREPAAPVDVVDDAVRRLIDDMGETMRAAPGIGLAAPQVGVQRRVLVYSLAEDEALAALVNPEIVDRQGEITDDEGCLSIPGLTFPVTRSQVLVVRAVDREGDRVEIEATDLEARVIQHEIDHLDGVLFIDRIAPELRKEAMRILRERLTNDTPHAHPSARL